MKYSIWAFIWDTTEIVYISTGLRIQAPIEWFWPGFAPYIFSKMIGAKGKRIVK